MTAFEGIHLENVPGAGLAERLARILNGPVSGKVHQASVYFDERGEREARTRAAKEAGRGGRTGSGPPEGPPGRVA